MQSLAIGRAAWTAVGRRWRGISRRRRAALGLLAALALAGTYGLSLWWTDWPARRVIRDPQGYLPLAFSPDGATLAATGFEDGGITLWDTARGTKRAFWGETKPMKQFGVLGAFAPDGRTFVAAWFPRSDPSASWSIDLIDVTTGRVRATIPTRHYDYHGLAFRDGGRVLRAVMSRDGAGEVLDCEVATGRVVSSHPVSVGAPSFRDALSPDGRLLAFVPYTVGVGPTTDVILWDIDRDREFARLPGRPKGLVAYALAFSADATTLGVGREDGSIELWDVGTRRLRATFPAHEPGFVPVRLTLSPDGSTLASGGVYGRRAPTVTSFLWEFDRLIGAPRFRRDERPTEVVLLDLATGRCLGLARSEFPTFYSPDGRTLATMGARFFKLRDVPTRPAPSGLSGHP
jgi:WD40 repeat protein